MPNTTASTLIAVYNTESEAQSAIREMKGAGLSNEQIQTHSKTTAGSAQPATTGAAREHETGFMGWLKSLFGADEDQTAYSNAYRDGRTVVSVRVSEQQVEQVADVLERYHPVDLREQEGSAPVKEQEATRASAAGAASSRSGAGTNTAGAVPVIREDMAVGKRAFQRGGVRVHAHLVEEPVEETVRLREERAFVDRQAVDRPATPADLKTGAEQVIEVEERAETPVVEKRARVVEEISVGKNASERSETVRDNLRHTEVEVEPLTTDRQTQTSAPSASHEDRGFRQHFQATYGNQGSPYETYAPAYSYGSATARDPRYTGARFADVERDIRTDYERRYPNSTWDKMKAAVQHGWDSVRGRA
jgi:uncharacterized protein (TIGR02271 family)